MGFCPSTVSVFKYRHFLLCHESRILYIRTLKLLYTIDSRVTVKISGFLAVLLFVPDSAHTIIYYVPYASAFYLRFLSRGVDLAGRRRCMETPP